MQILRCYSNYGRDWSEGEKFPRHACDVVDFGCLLLDHVQRIGEPQFLLTSRYSPPERLREFDTFDRGPEATQWVGFGMRSILSSK